MKIKPINKGLKRVNTLGDVSQGVKLSKQPFDPTISKLPSD